MRIQAAAGATQCVRCNQVFRELSTGLARAPRVAQVHDPHGLALARHFELDGFDDPVRVEGDDVHLGRGVHRAAHHALLFLHREQVLPQRVRAVAQLGEVVRHGQPAREVVQRLFREPAHDGLVGPLELGLS